MSAALWTGLALLVIGGAVSSALVFGGHRSDPAGTTGHATAVVPGVGRRLGSAVLLALLTVGLAGLVAAAVGTAVFVGGLLLKG